MRGKRKMAAPSILLIIFLTICHVNWRLIPLPLGPIEYYLSNSNEDYHRENSTRYVYTSPPLKTVTLSKPNLRIQVQVLRSGDVQRQPGPNANCNQPPVKDIKKKNSWRIRFPCVACAGGVTKRSRAMSFDYCQR
jgi:hypothetical protein